MIVIVGAGHAGFQLAVSLRQNDYDGDIKLINDERHLPYQRPPLSKTYLQGPGDLQSVAFRSKTFFEDHKIQLVFGAAARIDRTAHSVQLASGELVQYDHLVLATGARNRAFDVPCDATSDVAYLRSLEETEWLRTRLASARKVVVIGAGFIGLEFAATARVLGLHVNVIEMAPRVMARAVTPDVSDFFKKRHEATDVQFHFNARVTEVVQNAGHVVGVVLDDGKRIPTDLIVVGTGVIPNDGLASDAGLEVASGIVVNQSLLTNDADISAIGDCAAFPSKHAPQLIRVESVQNATDQARCVAARLMGSSRPYDSLPWFWSDQGKDKLQIAGLTAGYDHVVMRGDRDAGSFSIFCYRREQLLGIESINRPSDHIVGRKVLAGARNIPPCVASDVAVDLRNFIR